MATRHKSVLVRRKNNMKEKPEHIPSADGWDGHCFGFKIEARTQSDRKTEEQEEKEKIDKQLQEKKEKT